MSLWAAADAAAATGGRLTADWQASGVSIDTRSLKPGDLFVALKDVRDGHDFVARALEKGAAAALVSRVPEGVGEDAPLLIVEDVLVALERLGAAGRARTRAQVIGITGSVGKTSTKEMLRAVLARQGRVHAAEKSFNNHWGVPLTLARMPADTDFAIIEIGMNHPGEIAPLARLARLDVALITTVAPAHLEAFEDIAAIAREKASIVEGLTDEGIGIFCADVPEAAHSMLERKTRGEYRRIWFGTGNDNPWRIRDVKIHADCTVVQADTPGGSRLFRLAVPGRHFALNALGALAAVDALGADAALAALDLAHWRPPAGRGTREMLLLDRVDTRQTLALIDDSYNANPASVGAALEILAASLPVDGVGRIHKGRRIAILGDMLELGPQEKSLHTGLADLPAMQALDVVHCVGPRMAALHRRLPEERRGKWAETSAEMAKRAHSLLDAGDVVLVKGSLGSRVGVVVDAIRKLGHPLASENEGRV